MSRFFSTLLFLLITVAQSSQSRASDTAGSCENSSLTTTVCETACEGQPAPGATLLPLDCRCEKTEQGCQASGICQERSRRGLITGRSTDCKCEVRRTDLFRCETACPAASPGFAFIEYNCRCKKNRETKECVPSGSCREYNSNGYPTGNSAACLCNKFEF